MTPRKTHSFAFPITAALLVAASLRAATSFGQNDTGGGGLDACTAKLAYEAAKSASESADARYREIEEPDWTQVNSDTLSARPRSRDEAGLELFLNRLKKKEAEALAITSKSSITAKQAAQRKKDLDEQYDDWTNKTALKTKKTEALEQDIKDLMADIKKIDAKLSAVDPVVQAQIQEQQGKVTAAINDINSLTGTTDVDEAGRRIKDPAWKNFLDQDVIEKKYNLDNRSATNEEIEAAKGAYNTAVANARAKGTGLLGTYNKESRALTKLENEANNKSGDETLEKLKKAKQAELGNKVSAKATLAQEEPTDADMSQLGKQMSKARILDSAFRDLNNARDDLKLTEPWINARLARNKTEERMRQAQQDYNRGINAKDSALAGAKARFNELQGWITEQRNSLQGRPHDEEYWKTIGEIKSRARSSYTLMEADLSNYECFYDVKNMLDDIRARRAKIEAINIPASAGKSPPTRVTQKPPTRIAKAPTKKPTGGKKSGRTPKAKGTSSSVGSGQFAGYWVTSIPVDYKVTMRQNGSRVTGTFTGEMDGTAFNANFAGRVRGKTLTARYQLTHRGRTVRGALVLTLTQPNHFQGYWEYGIRLPFDGNKQR